MQIEDLGWNDHFARALEFLPDRGLTPARVAREERTGYILLTPEGERFGQVTGAMRHESYDKLDLPTVGDWVAARMPVNPEDQAVIEVLLPRRGCLTRKAAGKTTSVQIIAANIDTLFLVMGLDQDFSVNRMERYLTLAWEAAAQPVVLLNKADLSEDVEAQVESVEASAIGVPVHTMVATEGDGIHHVLPYLERGRTVALVGSSGVGKTTLINALLGENRLKTGAVREDDGRGRHTTTWRHLMVLPTGGVLIDTPGMRELQLWAGEESLDYSFSDIAEIAESCRFNDCTHQHEPGCAVLRAVQSGRLAPSRLESFHKLHREIQFLARKQDHLLRIAERNRWKRIHKSMRNHPKK